MPAFVQVMSFLYAIVVATAFLFHSIPVKVLPQTPLVAKEVVSYIQDEDLISEEPQIYVVRSCWFGEEDVVEAVIEPEDSDGWIPLSTLFEKFDREMTKQMLVVDAAGDYQDWF